MGLKGFGTNKICPKCNCCCLEVVSTVLGFALKCSSCLFGRDKEGEFEFDYVNIR